MMKKLLLILMLVAPAWSQITWQKLHTSTNTGTFGDYYNGYHQIRYDAFSGVTWVYSTDTADNGNGIYSIRLSYFNSGDGSYHNIGDNGQTTGGPCVASSATWPFTHHAVEQIEVDPLDHRLYIIGGTRGATIAPEFWYYPLTNPPTSTCPGGDSGLTGCKWIQVIPNHMPMATSSQRSPVATTTTAITSTADPVTVSITGTSPPSPIRNGDYVAFGTTLATYEIMQVSSGATGSAGPQTLVMARAKLGTTAQSSFAIGTTVTGQGLVNILASAVATGDITINMVNPATVANGDYIQLNGAEIVKVTAGGGSHCAGGTPGQNPLTVVRQQYNTSLASASSGASANGLEMLMNGGAIKWDSTNNVLLLFGNGFSGGKDLWVYCPTTNNPTPGTLTAAQSAVGCSINGADDWSDITPYSICSDSTNCILVETGLAGANSGKIPKPFYYPMLEYDPVHQQFMKFAGNYGSAATPRNDTWTAAWNSSTPIKSLVWTFMNPTCTGADCAAGPGPVASAPVPTSTGNELRIAHALDPATGKYYYHSSNKGTTNPPTSTQDWVYDSAANNWTEIQTNAAGAAPNYIDSMTWDSGRNGLVAWAQTNNPQTYQLSELWFGALPGGTAPSITTCGSGSTTVCPGGVLTTAYSQQINATGSSPITWSITAGALPAGLSMNTATGLITGTPTAT